MYVCIRLKKTMNRIAILISASQEGANEYIPIICVWTLQITSYCEGLLLELDLRMPLVQPYICMVKFLLTCMVFPNGIHLAHGN